MQQASAKRGTISSSSWSGAGCKKAAELQCRLLVSGLRALAVGGRMVRGGDVVSNKAAGGAPTYNFGCSPPVRMLPHAALCCTCCASCDICLCLLSAEAQVYNSL